MRFGALVEHYKWSIKFLQENLFVWLVVGDWQVAGSGHIV